MKRRPVKKAKGGKGKTTPTPKQPSGVAVPSHPGQVFVNEVTLDNTVPGGFRYEQVPTGPKVTG